MWRWPWPLIYSATEPIEFIFNFWNQACYTFWVRLGIIFGNQIYTAYVITFEMIFHTISDINVFSNTYLLNSAKIRELATLLGKLEDCCSWFWKIYIEIHVTSSIVVLWCDLTKDVHFILFMVFHIILSCGSNSVTQLYFLSPVANFPATHVRQLY